MREIYMVFGKFSTTDMAYAVSSVEHDTYAAAMNEIAESDSGYAYYSIEKMFIK